MGACHMTTSHSSGYVTSSQLQGGGSVVVQSNVGYNSGVNRRVAQQVYRRRVNNEWISKYFY